MNFDIVNTNIINVSVDAIVLPANTRLKEGSGTSRAIFEAAGRKQLTQACRKIGTCPVGSAVPTLAFDLNAKYIIHAVVPKWMGGENGEYELLSSAYLSSLNIADIMGCESIAFPLLASGNNGFDRELAFQIAKESIESFSGIHVKKVILVLFGNQTANLAKELGYRVLEIPVDLHKEAQKQAQKDKTKKMMDDGKEIALTFFDEQVQKGLEYLKDERNRKKILAAGVWIAKQAFKAAKK